MTSRKQMKPTEYDQTVATDSYQHNSNHRRQFVLKNAREHGRTLAESILTHWSSSGGLGSCVVCASCDLGGGFSSGGRPCLGCGVCSCSCGQTGMCTCCHFLHRDPIFRCNINEQRVFAALIHLPMQSSLSHLVLAHCGTERSDISISL